MRNCTPYQHQWKGDEVRMGTSLQNHWLAPVAIEASQVALINGLLGIVPHRFRVSELLRELNSLLTQFLPQQPSISCRIVFTLYGTGDSAQLPATSESRPTPEQGLYSFHQSDILIGSDRTCDLCFDDDRVSKHHALLTRYRQNLFLIDLQSASGTKVNQQVATSWNKIALNDDDEIEIAGHRLKFRRSIEESLKRRIYVSTPVFASPIQKPGLKQTFKPSYIACLSMPCCRDPIVIEIERALVASFMSEMAGCYRQENKVPSALKPLEKLLCRLVIKKAFEAVTRLVPLIACMTIGNIIERDQLPLPFDLSEPFYRAIALPLCFSSNNGLVRFYFPQTALSLGAMIVADDPASTDDRRKILNTILHHLAPVEIFALVLCTISGATTSEAEVIHENDLLVSDSGHLRFEQHLIRGFGALVILNAETAAFNVELWQEDRRLFMRLMANETRETIVMAEEIDPGMPLSDIEPTSQASLSSTAQFLVNSIRFPISIELTRIHMTLGQFSKLRIGEIIFLDYDPQIPVHFIVNSKRIGSGRLVEAEGKLAIQVIGLIHDPDDES